MVTLTAVRRGSLNREDAKNAKTQEGTGEGASSNIRHWERSELALDRRTLAAYSVLVSQHAAPPRRPGRRPAPAPDPVPAASRQPPVPRTRPSHRYRAQSQQRP